MLSAEMVGVGAAALREAEQDAFVPPFRPVHDQEVELPCVGKEGDVGLVVPALQNPYEPQLVSVEA